MPKVILEYNLPEEDNELKLAQRGHDYYCVIWDTLQEIRGYLKYGHNFKTVDDALEKIRDSLYEAQVEGIE